MVLVAFLLLFSVDVCFDSDVVMFVVCPCVLGFDMCCACVRCFVFVMVLLFVLCCVLVICFVYVLLCVFTCRFVL